LVLMGTTGSAVRLWDPANGKELPKLDGHVGSAFRVAMSLDSKTVVSGGRDSGLHVWDWPGGRVRRRIALGNLSQRGIQTLALSGDGSRAEVIFWGESALRLFDLQSGRELPQSVEAHRGPIQSMAIARYGGLVTCSTDNTIRVWDLRTGAHLREQ